MKRSFLAVWAVGIVTLAPVALHAEGPPVEPFPTTYLPPGGGILRLPVPHDRDFVLVFDQAVNFTASPDGLDVSKAKNKLIVRSRARIGTQLLLAVGNEHTQLIIWLRVARTDDDVRKIVFAERGGGPAAGSVSSASTLGRASVRLATSDAGRRSQGGDAARQTPAPYPVAQPRRHGGRVRFCVGASLRATGTPGWFCSPTRQGCESTRRALVTERGMSYVTTCEAERYGVTAGAGLPLGIDLSWLPSGFELR